MMAPREKSDASSVRQVQRTARLRSTAILKAGFREQRPKDPETFDTVAMRSP
jgi:hypothetical protein